MVVAVIVMEVQGEHAAMGLVQHMHYRGMIRIGERNRWRNHPSA
jgi:hypothetical protein